MSLRADGGGVAWLPWCAEAFARARTERKPILLSLVATWAEGCAEMDRESYTDPTTASLVSSTAIPIRVDADHRPDVADRYDLGGLPTTAFLTPDGQVLGGGTFVSAKRLRGALMKLSTILDTCFDAPRTSSAVDSAPLDDAKLLLSVFDSFDREHGGFGTGPKFPLTAPVTLAIDLFVENETPEMLEYAVRTLDAIGWGPLYDEQSGGFSRCAAAPDWSNPQSPRLLSTNALLLDLYLHAAEALRQDRWFQRAFDIVRYIESRGDSRGWPTADCGDLTTRFTDVNALAVSATLRAAGAFQDDALGKRSLDVLERVLLVAYKPGHGVAHTAKGARGLLIDQVSMSTANLNAWEATGNIVYRMMAEELAHYALRTMWDVEGGGLFDRDPEAEPVDPLPRRAKPFVVNCEAAILLRRLAEATNDQMFAERAQQILDAMSTVAPGAGPLAAHYLLARRAVLR